MFPFPVLLVPFLLLPVIEIFLFIQVGDWIGAWPTVGLVIFTSVMGAYLLRQQGLATYVRFQQGLERGEVPATQLLEGFLLLIGGSLLLLPGFFSDAIGLVCVLPFTRVMIAESMLRRGTFVGHVSSTHFHAGTRPGPDAAGPSRAGGGQTIEGEWRREDDREP